MGIASQVIIYTYKMWVGEKVILGRQFYYLFQTKTLWSQTFDQEMCTGDYFKQLLIICFRWSIPCHQSIKQNVNNYLHHSANLMINYWICRGPVMIKLVKMSVRSMEACYRQNLLKVMLMQRRWQIHILCFVYNNYVA